MKRTKSGLSTLSIVALVAGALIIACPTVFAAGGEELLEEALTHIRAGDYALADAKCREAMAADPDVECYARLMLAESYGARGRFEDAAAEASLARKKARLIPAETEIVLVMAQKALGRFTRAEERLGQAHWRLQEAISTGAPPEEIMKARIDLADTQAHSGQAQAAISGYVQLLGEHPEHEDLVRRALGRLRALWLRAEGAEGAISNLIGIVSTYPRTPAAGFAISSVARIEESRGRAESGIALYNAAASEFAGTAAARDALEGLLGLHRRAEDFQNAMDTARRIIEEYPTSDSALRGAELFFDLVHWRLHIQQATGALESIADDFPEIPLAPRCLARLVKFYRQEHMLDQAVGAIERLRRRYGFSPVARKAIKQAWNAYRTGENLAEMERMAREVLANSVSEQERRDALGTLYRLAVAHLSGGYTADAERVLEAAEKAFPEVSATSALRIQRGFAVMDFGLNRDAEKSFRQVLHAEPGNREAYYGLVEASARLRPVWRSWPRYERASPRRTHL